MAKLTPTPSQTVGPFYAYGLLQKDDATLAGPGAKGDRVTLTGIVADGGGAPVRDALVEVWQADAEGRFPGRDADADPAFRGFGRTLTDADGVFSFETVAPGPTPGGGNRSQAPHFAIGLFAAGLTKRAVTRIYLPDEAALAEDDVAAGLDDAQRAAIVAARSVDGGKTTLSCSLRLGGEGRVTLFED